MTNFLWWVSKNYHFSPRQESPQVIRNSNLFISKSIWIIWRWGSRKTSSTYLMHQYSSACISMPASVRISVHQYASVCISWHQYASVCISMHKYAEACISMHTSVCISMHQHRVCIQSVYRIPAVVAPCNVVSWRHRAGELGVGGGTFPGREHDPTSPAVGWCLLVERIASPWANGTSPEWDGCCCCWM